jgi:hypothetical protein
MKGKQNEEEKLGTKKGVRKGPVVVKKRPFNPKLKKVSKSEFLKLRELANKAESAADIARKRVLDDNENQSEDQEVAEGNTQDAQQLVESIKREITETREALKKDPKSKKLKTKMYQLEQKLNEAEDALEEQEETEN